MVKTKPLAIIAAALLLAQTFATRADEWRIEDVLGLRALTCSIDVDAAGVPHLAFFDALLSTDLYYTRRDPFAGWMPHELVDVKRTNGPDVVLKVGGDGRPRIGYSDPDIGIGVMPTLRFAEQIDGSWIREVVTPRVAFALSMALSGQGSPFMAYKDYGDAYTMHVAGKRGGSWVTRKVTNHEAGWIAVAIDAGGAAHIAYSDAPEGTIKYARLFEGVWHFETVETIGNVPHWNISIALNRAGQPRIAYAIDGSIRIAQRRAGSWRVEIVRDPEGPVPVSPVLQVDTAGESHLAYMIFAESSPTLRLRYARTRLAPGWKFQTVDANDLAIHSISFALDQGGAAHIGYVILDPLRLIRYATNRP